jgi:predicted HAD superfamily Cof-like phosphohydrolase
MTKTTLEQVREFHKTSGLAINDKPTIDNNDLNALRISLLREEFDELIQALHKRNKEDVLDALVDLQYVLDGAFLSFGFGNVKGAAFAEVHRSNMSKFENGQAIRRADGKILKGKYYSPPDLQQFIEY